MQHALAGSIDPVHVLIEEDPQLGGRPLALNANEQVHEPLLTGGWIHRRERSIFCNPQEVENEAHGIARHTIRLESPLDVGSNGSLVILVLEVEVAPKPCENGGERRVLVVRRAIRPNHANPVRLTGDEKLVAETRLPHARLRHDPDQLLDAVARPFQGGFESGELLLASDEGRQAASLHDVEARARLAQALGPKRTNRVAETANLDQPQLGELDIRGCKLRRLVREQDLSRLGHRLHAIRESDRLPLGRVVHAQVVADPPHDDFTRVQAHADGKVNFVLTFQLGGERSQLGAEPERGSAGTQGMVFLGKWSPKERHDSVARVLVHRAPKTMDGPRRDLEEVIQHVVPCLWADALGQGNGLLDVHEERRHGLQLPFEGGP
jgi:hypothetical protein